MNQRETRLGRSDDHIKIDIIFLIRSTKSRSCRSKNSPNAFATTKILTQRRIMRRFLQMIEVYIIIKTVTRTKEKGDIVTETIIVFSELIHVKEQSFYAVLKFSSLQVNRKRYRR